MADNEYRLEVEDHEKDALKWGARVLTGGRRPDSFRQGYYCQPTIVTDVNHEMLARKDIWANGTDHVVS